MATDSSKTIDQSLPRDLGGVYRLTHTLGEGGMGVVYGGEHLALQRQVAVKMMRLALAVNQNSKSKPSSVSCAKHGRWPQWTAPRGSCP